MGVCLCVTKPTYHEGHTKLADGNVLSGKCFRTIRVDGTALVEKISDDVYTAYYNHWPTANHDAVDRSILLSPFGELKVFISARNLAQL